MSKGVKSIRVVALALCVLFGIAAQAFALPAGRAYEQVSPVFKGGYGVKSVSGVALDGESVAFQSQGAFAGTPLSAPSNAYQASRGAGGWSSVSLMPPASLSPFLTESGFSPSLGSSLWLFSPGPNMGGANYGATKVQFAVHPADTPDSETGFGLIGPVLERVDGGKVNFVQEGVSDDFCHVLVGRVTAMLLEAVGAAQQMYDVGAGCHDEPASSRLVALNNVGGLLSPYCSPDPGSDIFRFNAVSADGSEVFFRAIVPNEQGCLKSGQVFVRVGGERTLEVSRPLDTSKSFGGCVGEAGGVPGEVPCVGAATRATATFRGASQDGSKVFFTTVAQLVGGDKDASNDLYMATIGCPVGEPECRPAQREVTSLVQVSHAPTVGEAAEVQGVVSVARDGSRVYFVARGVLSEEGPVTQGARAQPVKGADNLYVYDSVTDKTAFVADLCSGPGLSGAMADSRCPADLEKEASDEVYPRNDTGLWNRFPLAQTAGFGGRFLVFSVYARLIAEGPQADTDNAQDVYRYDAQTGRLERVSVGEGGYAANGNRPDVEKIGAASLGNADARIQQAETGELPDEERSLVRRASSEDGSRIVFRTAEPLSPNASNGLTNIYEWHEGDVSLISTGSALEADEDAVITASGNDVFFVTVQGLVPQDTDGAPDVYDARLGRSFPLALAERQQCSGDACQGPLTNPAPLLVPGSVSQAPGENLPPPKKQATTKRKIKKKASTTKKKRKGKRAARARRGGRTANRGRGRR
jgi:hypothetical protein